MNIQIKPYDDVFFSLSFDGPFNNSMLNAVRSIPGRKYQTENKQYISNILHIKINHNTPR